MNGLPFTVDGIKHFAAIIFGSLTVEEKGTLVDFVKTVLDYGSGSTIEMIGEQSTKVSAVCDRNLARAEASHGNDPIFRQVVSFLKLLSKFDIASIGKQIVSRDSEEPFRPSELSNIASDVAADAEFSGAGADAYADADSDMPPLVEIEESEEEEEEPKAAGSNDDITICRMPEDQ